MPAAQRQGDANSAGGIATSGVSSVRVNGRPVVVNNIRVTAHPCCGRKGCPPIHCHAVTSSGSGTVRAGGIPVIRTGDRDTCGHTRIGGSGDVRVA